MNQKKLTVIIIVITLFFSASLAFATLSDDFIKPYRDPFKRPFPECQHIIVFDEEGKAYREWYVGSCGHKTTSKEGIEPIIKNYE